jgi:protein-tyrosine phosphatase
MLEGCARQVREADFRQFDLLIALDRSNLRDLLAIAPDEEAAEKVRLLREFDPASADGDLDVPDPYYGGDRGFDTVLDMVESACRGLLDELRARV